MDPVKWMIAQAVQHHLVTGKEQPAIPPKPDNVETAEGQAISATETLVRVITTNQGVRYFRVKVSEMLLWVSSISRPWDGRPTSGRSCRSGWTRICPSG